MTLSLRAFGIVLTIVGLLGPARSTSVAQDERPPVAPIEVCVDDGHGALWSGTATAGWAGLYDPRRPVRPELLNWMVVGAGCVSYPGPYARRASCGDGAARAVVTRVVCQR